MQDTLEPVLARPGRPLAQGGNASDEAPGLVVTDRHDRIVYINPRAEQLFECEVADVVGQCLDVIVSTAARVQKRTGRRRDGSEFAIHVRGSTVELNRESMHVYVVEPAPAHDSILLDDRELLLDVAHELRTPVATIMASTEVLAEVLASRLGGGLLLLVHNLEHESQRLASLIDNLLDLNAMRVGGGRLHPARCDLREVARAAASSILPLARRRRQTLAVSLPRAPVWACVDAGLLERAVLNLLSNAQKYGAEAGRVSLRLKADGTCASLAVEDDGPGIPPEDRERIFERLYRGAAARAQRIQGSGLGLPLCRAVVELHGGRVAVADGAMGGSLFTIELPLGL